jgi:hypothetical protein
MWYFPRLLKLPEEDSKVQTLHKVIVSVSSVERPDFGTPTTNCGGRMSSSPWNYETSQTRSSPQKTASSLFSKLAVYASAVLPKIFGRRCRLGLRETWSKYQEQLLLCPKISIFWEIDWAVDVEAPAESKRSVEDWITTSLIKWRKAWR